MPDPKRWVNRRDQVSPGARSLRPCLRESDLSKEIESATQLQIAQRTKNNLAVAFGPYVLLGAYLVALEKAPAVSQIPWWSIVVFVGVYGLLGFLAGRIEARIWGKCSEWREQLAEVTGLAVDKLRWSEAGVATSYLVVCAALGVVFCGLLMLIERLSVAT